jgi:hypothetical protein
MIGVPLYVNPNYKFSYSSLYPREHTEIVAANVKNNMKFVSLDQSERTSMGPSIMSLSWMNSMGEMGNNDAALFPPQYIERIRSQQKFDFSIVAIVLKGRLKENTTNIYDGYDGTVYDANAGNGREVPLTNAYILPGGQAFISAPSMFLFPITRFVPYSDSEGYLFAYKLNFTRDPSDPLSDYSLKTDLKEIHDRLVNACVMGTDGTNNGLSQYFNGNVADFKGFKMPSGLARSETGSERKEFLDSIEEAYRSYYSTDKFSSKPKVETCQESLRGLGLIISSAAITNGFWLPEVMDYIQK